MIPKVELHLHLEGAAPPDFIRRLAGEKRRSLPAIFDEAGAYRYTDFTDFLRIYEAATAVIDGPEDYARLLTEVLEICAANGAIYVETFVSPDFCGGGDLHAWRDHLAAMAEAAARAPVESRAIVTAIRHFGPDHARATARCAAETAGGWLAGFGLAGAETVGRPQDFAWSFDCAREAGLGLTCHAGEWGGPQSIRDALTLGVSRIGHGVRAIEDPALVRHLADTGITLETCPGSNVALGIYPGVAAHPIAALREAGCRVTVSTDDPPFFHTTLEREYEALSEAFGWTEADFRQMNTWALDAAFCDPATRDRLKERL